MNSTNSYVNADAIKASYAPYNKLEAFEAGYADYMNMANHGVRRACSYSGVQEQAYDRGFEAAMRVRRANEWVDQNVGSD